MAVKKLDKKSVWQAAIYVPSNQGAAPVALRDESVTTHSRGLGSWLSGEVEGLNPDVMADDWRQKLDAIVDIAGSTAETHKGWHIDEMEIGLTLSAEGKLLFIAKASAQASVKIKLKRGPAV
jgi:hypothetical protein